MAKDDLVYMNIDIDVVWKTATQELGPLLAKLEKIAPPEEDPTE
jgi:uncharacterized protein with HEPN domain